MKTTMRLESARKLQVQGMHAPVQRHIAGDHDRVRWIMRAAVDLHL